MLRTHSFDAPTSPHALSFVQTCTAQPTHDSAAAPTSHPFQDDELMRVRSERLETPRQLLSFDSSLPPRRVARSRSAPAVLQRVRPNLLDALLRLGRAEGLHDQRRLKAAAQFAVQVYDVIKSRPDVHSRLNFWCLSNREAAGRALRLYYHLRCSTLRPHDAMMAMLHLTPGPRNLSVPLCPLARDTPRWAADSSTPTRIDASEPPGVYYLGRSRLHLVFLNPQGNFDAWHTGLGSHADFGGQLVYVQEVAQALGRLGVAVDIVTRRLKDARWPQFEQSQEVLLRDGERGPDGTVCARVRILRIAAGPEEFLRKEDLWPHLDAWAHNIAAFYAEEGELPHAASTHYADGGLSGTLLRDLVQLPFATFTAHSLGAQKIDGLILGDGDLDPFNFDRRIAAERLSMSAERIITSTTAERTEQYAHPLYIGAVPPETSFVTIPPGVNLQVFGAKVDPTRDAPTVAALQEAMNRDLPPERRRLPVVIAAGRLDAKKNHINIVRAFAHNPALRDGANLLLLLTGGPVAFRDPDASGLTGAQLQIAHTIKDTLHANGLEDQVVVPGLRNTQTELAAIYRYLAQDREGAPRGIFCLVSDNEPFGLMPLEAMGAGLPVVVTQNGGPRESMQRAGQMYGLLVNPQDPADIAAALWRLAKDPDTWRTFKARGQRWVQDEYTWNRTAQRYRDTILQAIAR